MRPPELQQLTPNFLATFLVVVVTFALNFLATFLATFLMVTLQQLSLAQKIFALRNIRPLSIRDPPTEGYGGPTTGSEGASFFIHTVYLRRSKLHHVP